MTATDTLIQFPKPSPAAAVFTTLLFTDIVGSTRHAVELGDAVWSRVLAWHDRTVREEVARYGGRLIKSLGDGYMVAFQDSCAALNCAHALVDSARIHGLEIRAGVHSGQCRVIGDDLAGLNVHIAARVCSLASGGSVLATAPVAEPVRNAGGTLVDRGSEVLRDIPGEFRLFEAMPQPASLAC